MITNVLFNVSNKSTDGNGRIYLVKDDSITFTLVYYSARHYFVVPRELAKTSVPFDTFLMQYNAYNRMLSQVNVLKTLLLYRLAEEQDIKLPDNAIVVGVNTLNQVIDEAIAICSRKECLEDEFRNISASGTAPEIFYQLEYVSKLTKFKVDTYQDVKDMLDKMEASHGNE